MPLRFSKDCEDNSTDNSIPVRELRDQQVAQITVWPWVNYIGELVIRCNRHLVSLVNGGRWEAIPQDEDCRVRVIPNGIITLEVFDNE